MCHQQIDQVGADFRGWKLSRENIIQGWAKDESLRHSRSYRQESRNFNSNDHIEVSMFEKTDSKSYDWDKELTFN